MAMPSHSPSMPFNGAGSPPRALAGYPDQHNTFPMYGPHPQSRPMPPPSPQHYPQRYPSQPPLPPPMSMPYGQPSAPQKRPGSSMSISSMLGTEPERPNHDMYHHVRSSSHGQPQPMHAGPPMGALMSPPQYPPRSNPQDYAYKPRAKTPDRYTEHNQNRYRSGSGSLMQRPSPFADNVATFDHFPAPRYQEHPPFGAPVPMRDDVADRARRTSLSGILQRPDSAPQSAHLNGHNTVSRPDSAAPISTNGDVFAPRNPPVDRSAPSGGSYDTRPPPFNTKPPPARAPYEKRDAQSLSPDLRRVAPNGPDNSRFNGILNENTAAQNMARQDSVQSQSSAFGDRYRQRPYSPFSMASQTSMQNDEYGRKGSDEMTHRTVLGLANDSRRGRYSPVPQAVQGAQAQTPVPEAAQKAEQGRVFAGLGGGLGSGPTSTPVGLSSSPFREGAARLSEENLMKMSRSTSGMGKRARRLDDDIRAESEAGDGKKRRKGGGAGGSKYVYSNKPLDDIPRRGTPLSVPAQRINSALAAQATSRPVFKPRQTIRTLSVINAAAKKPRRHLGNFKYDPTVSNSDLPKSAPGSLNFDLGVRPNAVPTFDQTSQVNCTYSIRVPQMWLQERERRMIARERYLWGTGIYTDDTDVVAAAMHSGFLKSAPPENADKVLLDTIAKEQNAKIEGLPDLPEQPLVPEAKKDAIITCIVLPCLETYQSSNRFSIQSRQWPDTATGAEHDGVSFAIHKVEFVSGGVEARRTGRTGKERRERLRKEMEERRRSQIRIKEIAERVNRRTRKVHTKVRKNRNGENQKKELANKAALNSLKEKMRAAEEEEKKRKGKENAGVTATTTGGDLDFGKAPGEWLKQLETSAVDA